MGFAVVAAGAVSKTDFVNEPCIFQVSQRVVDGCVADAGQPPARSLKDVAGGGVVVSFLDDLKNRLPLGRQLWLRLVFLLCGFHDGFRLILNRPDCQARVIGGFLICLCVISALLCASAVYLIFKTYSPQRRRETQRLRRGKLQTRTPPA